MAEGAGQITASLTLDIKGFTDAIKKAQGALDKMTGRSGKKGGGASSSLPGADKKTLQVIKETKKNIKSLSDQIRAGQTAAGAAGQSLEGYKNSLKKLGKELKKDTEEFRQFNSAMATATGMGGFIATSQTAASQMSKLTSQVEAGGSKFSTVFSAMSTGGSGAMRATVMSFTNITEAFQKGLMGGRQFAMFFMGDLTDAMMIGSFHASAFAKAAAAATGATKAFLMTMAKWIIPVQVALTILSGVLGLVAKEMGWFQGKSEKAAEVSKDVSSALMKMSDAAGETTQSFAAMSREIQTTTAVALSGLMQMLEDQSLQKFVDQIDEQLDSLKDKGPADKTMRKATDAMATSMMELSRQTALYQEQSEHVNSLSRENNKLIEKKIELEKQAAKTGFGWSTVAAYDVLIEKGQKHIEKQQEILRLNKEAEAQADKAASDNKKRLDEVTAKVEQFNREKRKSEAKNRQAEQVRKLIEEYKRLLSTLEAFKKVSLDTINQSDKMKAKMKQTSKRFHEVKNALNALATKGYKKAQEAADKFMKSERLKIFKQTMNNIATIEKHNHEQKLKMIETEKRARDAAFKAQWSQAKKVSGSTSVSAGGALTGSRSARVPGLGALPRQSRDIANTKERRDSMQEARETLAAIRTFKKPLLALGFSTRQATAIFNSLSMAGQALVAFFDDFSAGVGEMTMGNFSNVLAMTGKGAGMGVAAAFGADPETGGKIGEALGAFSDMMVGKIEVKTNVVDLDGNAVNVNMGELLAFEFNDQLKQGADAFKPLADVVFHLASNLGGLLAMLSNAFAPLIDMVANVLNMVFNVIFMIFATLGPAFAFVTGALLMLSPVVEAAANFVHGLISAVFGLVTMVLSAVSAIASMAIQLLTVVPVLEIFATLLNGFSEGFIVLADAFGHAAVAIGEFVRWVGESTRNEGLQDMGQDLMDLAGDFLQGLDRELGPFGRELQESADLMAESNEQRSKANKEASKVLNAPQGFKIEKYRYEAMNREGMTNPYTGAPLNQNNVNIYGAVTVIADSPEDFMTRMQNNANRVGSINPQFGG
jgi:hypothetical protein